MADHTRLVVGVQRLVVVNTGDAVYDILKVFLTVCLVGMARVVALGV